MFEFADGASALPTQDASLIRVSDGVLGKKTFDFRSWQSSNRLNPADRRRDALIGAAK